MNQQTQRLLINVSDEWLIVYHELRDEDPLFDDGACINLSEDLFQMVYKDYIIDAGYYRNHYKIALIQEQKWQHPLRQKECQHRKDVVKTIEEWSKILIIEQY